MEMLVRWEVSSAMPNDDDNGKGSENVRAVYSEFCTSYHAIDDFRAKFLGLLPTGTGIFLLIPELLKAGLPKGGEGSQQALFRHFRSLSEPLGL